MNENEGSNHLSNSRIRETLTENTNKNKKKINLTYRPIKQSYFTKKKNMFKNTMNVAIKIILEIKPSLTQ